MENRNLQVNYSEKDLRVERREPTSPNRTDDTNVLPEIATHFNATRVTKSPNPPALFCRTCNDSSHDQISTLPKLPIKKKKRRRHAKMVYSAPERELEDSLAHKVLSVEDETCVLHVSNLINPSQNLLIDSVLEQMNSVMAIQKDLETKTVKITYNPIAISVQTIIKSLQDLGLDAKENSSTSQRQRELEQDDKGTLCRSSLYVQGICCPTEVPIVKRIIRNMSKSGVKKISVNIPSRMVYVEHEYSSVTVRDFERELNREGFGASIRKDGASHLNLSFNEDLMSCSASNFVESTLLVRGLENRVDVDYVAHVFEELPQKIRNYSCNLASRTIKIEHDPKLLSASTAAELLVGDEGFDNVTVHVDGAEEGLVLPDIPDNFTNEAELEKNNFFLCRTYKRDGGLNWNIAISGICWVISLIGSCLDGNW
jgi:copper chaperone CopZ